MSEVEQLLQFLYLVPVGLIEADVHTGTVRKLNPLATEVLLTAGRGHRIDNVYAAFSPLYPELSVKARSAEKLGLIIENEHVELSMHTNGKDNRILALSLHKISEDTLAVVLNDVTKLVLQERELRLREAQLRAIVDSVQAHMIVPINVNGDIEEYNHSIERLTGYSDAIVGSPISALFAKSPDVTELLKATEKQGWIELSCPMNHDNGQSWWGASVLTRIVDEESETIGFSLITREDTERHNREEQLTQWAGQDMLTGTTNRRAFQEVVEQEIARAKRYERHLSFILLDIDHFKKINDTWGHHSGDEVLRELSERLKLCVRKPDYLVRLGGEEFGLLLPETSAEEAAVVGERVRALVADSPFTIEGGSLEVTISLGVVSTSQVFCEVFEWMYRAADTALYRAKEQGRNQVQLATIKEIREVIGDKED